MEYCLTQCFTGHGSFMSYLHRIGKRQSDVCVYCPERDDAEHTLFRCRRWDNERADMERRLGRGVTADSLAEEMLTSMEKWQVVAEYAKKVIGRKEADEHRSEV